MKRTLYNRPNKPELNAKAEMALMGATVVCDNNAQADYILNYIFNVLDHKDTTPEKVIEEAFKYSKGDVKRIRHLVVNTLVDGQVCIAMTLTTSKEEEKYYKLVDPQGTFAYVYNLTTPIFSELGYCFFKDVGGLVKRVG